MTTDIGIQDLLDKIDNLTDLIAKVKIAEQYKDIQRIKNDTLVEYQNKIQEAEREIEGNSYYTVISQVYSYFPSQSWKWH